MTHRDIVIVIVIDNEPVRYRPGEFWLKAYLTVNTYFKKETDFFYNLHQLQL